MIDSDEAGKRLTGLPAATGPKLAAIARDALGAERQKGKLDPRCPGIVIGWSRGGEGALTLAASPASPIKAAIVFYPSVRGQRVPYAQSQPVLALEGDRDTLAPVASIRKLMDTRAPGAPPFELVVFPGAKHRFDVARPTDNPAQTRLEPDYDPEATAASHAAIARFLKAHEITTAGCALD